MQAVAHELRTPIARIRFSSEMLREAPTGAAPGPPPRTSKTKSPSLTNWSASCWCTAVSTSKSVR
jgi:signal transduction histidine kinase